MYIKYYIDNFVNFCIISFKESIWMNIYIYIYKITSCFIQYFLIYFRSVEFPRGLLIIRDSFLKSRFLGGKKSFTSCKTNQTIYIFRFYSNIHAQEFIFINANSVLCLRTNLLLSRQTSQKETSCFFCLNKYWNNDISLIIMVFGDLPKSPAKNYCCWYSVRNESCDIVNFYITCQ